MKTFTGKYRDFYSKTYRDIYPKTHRDIIYNVYNSTVFSANQGWFLVKHEHLSMVKS